MKRLSRCERRASEFDTMDLPISEVIIDWKHFNSDLFSTDRSYLDIEQIALKNPKERLDLRPYMICNPQTVFTTDVF